MSSSNETPKPSNGPDWAMITLLRGGMLGGKPLPPIKVKAVANNDQES